ncbi:MAG: flagellar hook-associated protein 3 [Methylococcaceae bacterium]|nr:MAG: flagellar hook-associated protein 3 [Methylococcaceae bacterium]
MRVATAFAQYQSTTAMLAQQAKLSNSQMQLSTGEKILKPADDPSGSVRALDLTVSINTVKQYDANVNFLKEKLTSEESAIQGGMDVLNRARELTVQAVNGTNTPHDRAEIGLEIEQLRDQLLSLANTRTLNGEYLFAGVRSQTVPFVKTPVQSPAYGFAFQGDVFTRELQMSAVRQLPQGDSGFSVFQDIPSSSVTASANNGKQNIMTTLQLLSDVLQNGQVRSGAGGVVGADLSAALSSPTGLIITAGVDDTVDLAVDGVAGDVITIAPPAAPATGYTDINALVSSINTGIQTSTLNGAVTAYAYGNSVQFVSSTTGNASSVSVNAPAGGIGFAAPQTGVGQQIQPAAALVGAVPNFPLTYAANTPFGLAIDGGVQTPVEIPAGSYSDINGYVAAINAGIAAAGLDTQVTAQADGNKVAFVTASSGTKSSIQIFGAGDNQFLKDAGFSPGQMVNGQAPEVIAMSALLADIDAAIARFTDTEASIGARLNAVDLQLDVHSKLTLDMKTALSETKDVDYAEAISRFSLEQTALQAAQQSFVKVQGLSLFNYMG